ncbi:hypothetical protein CF67_04088 [Candidatus Photodesmus blepharus]|uniref:tRNA threonylcarbamoyladenosine biosynthesis protein TsaB n=1 Tax=Candidatus Photodesmus blepharonis TaxID=1179155 RepID=A0A084CMR5_9GAMM|nr:tRNA (adenosine(37)-N6)-threonylcarbamoyltransferase complex dimerization subunit type 1 TsaB [Candidatus Photodesmus blepharus]KEY91094.1 hypothetical protein CF67_04088 [Candidatus Photodesmus blepharus]
MNTKILALSTATEECSVALSINNKLYTRSEISPQQHAKKILPMVDEVLKEANVNLSEIDAIAYNRGPGSFTGIRIGVSIAKGLGFAENLPMVGISNLKAIAQSAYRQLGLTRVACAIDARMNEVYWGCFTHQEDGNWKEVDTECVISLGDLTKHLFNDKLIWGTAGTGWSTYPKKLGKFIKNYQNSQILYSQAQDIAYLAKFELLKGNATDAEQANPVYLRDIILKK